MQIRTKSLQLSKNKSDGIRICVMRHIRPEYDFDMWIPRLAPPESLVKKYVVDKKISWKEFMPLFQKRVIDKNKRLIRMLVDLSRHTNVTLLCWEKSATKCHRSLLLKACRAKIYSV